MNIIIVRNAHTVPRRLELSGRRSRLLAVAALAGCALFFIALGAVSTFMLGGTRGNDLREIAELRASLAAQRDALVGLGEDSHRNLDAFAMHFLFVPFPSADAFRQLLRDKLGVAKQVSPAPVPAETRPPASVDLYPPSTCHACSSPNASRPGIDAGL